MEKKQKSPIHVAAGKKSRRKGKVFERAIATELREAFPTVAENIRRSIQSRKAEESDVWGLPGFWIECQSTVAPTPRVKLNQAIGDLAASSHRGFIPVAITQRKGTRAFFVHMRLVDFHTLTGYEDGASYPALHDILVTIEFTEWLNILRIRNPQWVII